jgi:hypothetical protein
MKASKAKIINGRLIETEVKMIEQNTLTADCWLIQMFGGLSECDTCEVRNTEECGGGETLKRMRAAL